MSTYTDIQALKARCTALETKDKALSTAATALTARVAKLEAIKPVDYSIQIAALQKEVGDLRYIISKSGWKSLLSQSGAGKLSAAAVLLGKSVAPSSYYNVLTDGGCHGDGVTDDTNHILAAITAYKAGGYTGLYFPAGTYYVNPASRLSIPANTVMVGAGAASTAFGPAAITEMSKSWIKGKLVFGSGCSTSQIQIGLAGFATYFPGGSTTSTYTRFIGGGYQPAAGNTYEETWPYCDGSAVTISSGTSNMTFNDCIFHPAATAHDPTGTYKWHCVSSFGGSYHAYTRCQFDESGEFGIEMWSDGGDPQHHDFSYCRFDGGRPGSHIDYAMTPSSYCTVDHCTFGSTGVAPYAHDPGHVNIEAAGGHHFTVTNNTMVRGGWCSIMAQHGEDNITISGNTIDMTSGVADIPMYSPSGQAIWVGGTATSNNCSITNNSISALHEYMYSPAIEVTGDTNTVTGNTVTGWEIDASHGQTDPANITVTGTGNTVSGNVIQARA